MHNTTLNNIIHKSTLYRCIVLSREEYGQKLKKSYILVLNIYMMEAKGLFDRTREKFQHKRIMKI